MLEKEALRVEDVCYRFLKVNVLDHFIFSVGEGEICCLFGAHNAGKTTFMQLLAGKATGTWEMRVLIDGLMVNWDGPRAAQECRFAFVWEESSLIHRLSVADNLFLLGRIPLLTPYVKNSVYEAKTKEILAAYGLQEIDPKSEVSCLTKVQCFLLEIVRCVMGGARFLFLDCLPGFQRTAELGQLEKLLKQLAAQGKTIILLTNRADERLFFADKFVIMRNGRRAKTLRREEVSVKELRDYGEIAPGVVRNNSAKGFLDEKNMTAAVKQLQVLDRCCTFMAYRGKLTGIFCPDECYAQSLIQSIEKGKIPAFSFMFENREYAGKNIPGRVRRKICIVKSLLAERTLITNFNALDNVCISLSGLGWITPRLRKDIRLLLKKEERELLFQVDEAMKEHREESLLNLKIVAKRALLMQCTLVLLERPMQGLDESSCMELFDILRSLASQGIAVVLLECRKAYLQKYCDLVAEFE